MLIKFKNDLKIHELQTGEIIAYSYVTLLKYKKYIPIMLPLSLLKMTHTHLCRIIVNVIAF